MLNGKRIAVVMPAYNAEKTLERTVAELTDIVDIRILVDDSSSDNTAGCARRLGVLTFVHDSNYGYGRNQQTCYREALAAGADIVVMLHPDYQYTPLLVPAMAGMIASGVYDMVLASRILGAGALKGGMPRYKYVFNRLLTAFQNLFLGVKLSEYHTGFRAFSSRLLQTLPLDVEPPAALDDPRHLQSASAAAAGMDSESWRQQQVMSLTSSLCGPRRYFGLAAEKSPSSTIRRQWKLVDDFPKRSSSASPSSARHKVIVSFFSTRRRSLRTGASRPCLRSCRSLCGPRRVDRS